MSLEKEIAKLEPLQNELKRAREPIKKIALLDRQDSVQHFLQQNPGVASWLTTLTPIQEAAVKSLLAIGQGSHIFQGFNPNAKDKLSDLLSHLIEIDKFYDTLGGIVGYHVSLLKLIVEKEHPKERKDAHTRYLKPLGYNISKNAASIRKAIRYYVEHLDQVAEIYPVGGAGDRLDLKDEKTGEPLPSAWLQFCGFTLLEGLFRDLHAREYLHYKLMGKQICTPVAMMTSHEKNNHEHIKQIGDRSEWFGRPKHGFFLFTQPLVPLVTVEGKWASEHPMTFLLKPGGHGAIWKLAQDKKVFEWFKAQERIKGLVRQINNPIAGLDYGLAAFVGLGLLHNKVFGFASCPRLLNAAEGMNVLIETERRGDSFAYRLTNIEYTEFAQKGIHDIPSEPEGNYSIFPANTNILFVDFHVIQEVIKEHPIPGMLINLKHNVSMLNHKGEPISIKAGRLESTMQNVADHIVDLFDHQLKPQEFEKLRSYIVFNERKKTISVTKNAYHPGKSILETPEGCFYDLLLNYQELLTNYCHMKAPRINSEEEYIKNGPSMVVYLHPAIGPFYSLIAQKIRGGKLAEGAEFQAQIAELSMEEVSISGSLLIEAERILGHKEGDGILVYSEDNGKCFLKNVQIQNKGINRKAPNCYWKMQIERHEALKITLKGNAEFHAKNVSITGNHTLEVPDGHRMTVTKERGKLKFAVEKIEAPTWSWKYQFDEEDAIRLDLKNWDSI